jgi:hypothetical protein
MTVSGRAATPLCLPATCRGRIEPPCLIGCCQPRGPAAMTSRDRAPQVNEHDRALSGQIAAERQRVGVSRQPLDFARVTTGGGFGRPYSFCGCSPPRATIPGTFAVYRGRHKRRQFRVLVGRERRAPCLTNRARIWARSRR